MSITIELPADGWTVAAIERLPNAGLHVEIHEGKLVMMSPARQWHSEVVSELRSALKRRGHLVGIEVGVKAAEDDLRVPDVAIFADEPARWLQRAYFAPDEIALAVEVVSASSMEEDRVIKPLWYAAHGIPGYWRVEEDVETGDALIYQYKLARTDDGKSAYIDAGFTTLAKLQAVDD